MAINQNGSGRGGAGSNGSDINDIVNRLGGPRVVIVLAVVVVIAIVAVMSITSGISDTNRQTEQRAEGKKTRRRVLSVKGKKKSAARKKRKRPRCSRSMKLQTRRCART